MSRLRFFNTDARSCCDNDVGCPAVSTKPDELSEMLHETIHAEIAPMFDELRRFTDRRIAELSAEVHAAVQMVDFSEENLSGQLGRIQGQVAALIAMPSAATRSSGLELEAVVQATEAAANQIMEAAEAIGEWLRNDARDQQSLNEVANRLNSIFEACSFQDVTGQRIRRAIQHLQHVEDMLTEISPQEGEKAPRIQIAVNPDLVQADVDRVFGLNAKPQEPPAQAISPGPAVSPGQEMSQEELDRLFG
jgi:chemotaxis protein CheZ